MNHGKEIKIALVALLGLFILFVGMNFLKGLNAFSKGEVYYLSFENVAGLTSSTPIYAEGYPVGKVLSIDYDYSQKENTKVAVDIDPQMRIPKGTTAVIEGDMLGNVRVNLVLAKNLGETVNPGEVIPGGMASGLMSKAADMLPAVEQLLPKIDSILTGVNALLSNPAIAQTLQNLEATSNNLAATTKETNKLVSTLNAQMPGMMTKADGVLSNAQTMTGNLAKVDVEATMAKVNETLANVQAVTEKINSNEGTLGLLMRDPDLYNHLSSTANSADSLLVDLRMHPKRYVHFSLFGKKDK